MLGLILYEMSYKNNIFFYIVSSHFVPNLLTVAPRELPYRFSFRGEFIQNAINDTKMLLSSNFINRRFFYLYSLMEYLGIVNKLNILYKFQLDTSMQARGKWSWQADRRTTKWYYDRSVVFSFWSVKSYKCTKLPTIFLNITFK